MAPKRPNPKEEEEEHPPANSTTEEEEDSSSDASSSEDEEKEKVKQKAPKPSSPPPKKPETTTTATATTTTPKPQSPSSSESEEDSEGSDSEKSEPEKAQIKPIATKPMEETTKTTKPRSKPAATATATPAAKSTVKRAIGNDDDKKEPKKAKKGSSSEPEDDSKQLTADPKKLLFQRLWSEDDEIAVLKGYIEYTAKTGADPMTDMNAFLDYIKDSLHFDVTKSQLHDKIRRLKKKYENNLGRGKKGNDPIFSKPHEEKAYEWSKKVWAGGEGVESSAAAAAKFNGKTRTPRVKAAAPPKFAEYVSSPERKQTKVKKSDEIKVESQNEDAVVLFDKNVALTGDMNEYVINHGMELVDGSKKAELEERWRKLQLDQLELFVERSKLIYDQSKLMLEAAKALN